MATTHDDNLDYGNAKRDGQEQGASGHHSDDAGANMTSQYYLLNSFHSDVVKRLVQAAHMSSSSSLSSSTAARSSSLSSEGASSAAHSQQSVLAASSSSSAFSELLLRVLFLTNDHQMLQLPKMAALQQSRKSVEARASILQDFLTKPKIFRLDVNGCSQLISWVSGAIRAFPKSTKVASVLLRLLQHHKHMAKSFRDDLLEISANITSFMKKTLRNKLTNLA